MIKLPYNYMLLYMILNLGILMTTYMLILMASFISLESI